MLLTALPNEAFFTALPVAGFTANDVVKLYLYRGNFKTVLAEFE